MDMDRPALNSVGPDIWLADGPQVTVAGFVYPTRSAIVRLSGDRLFIWSPVALSPTLREAVDKLGEVHFLVAPNSLHHLFLGDWKRAYPKALLCAPPSLRAKRRDLLFDADIVEVPNPGWAGELDQVAMVGNLITCETVFFHVASRTALFADLIQHLPPGALRGWRAWLARLDLMTGPVPEVPRKFRMAFLDRRAARAALDRILDWPVERVVMAHAEPVMQDGQAFLRRAFRWLSG